MRSPDKNDDATLIRAAQRRDFLAFATLVQRHHAGVRACLGVRLHNSHDAEDLTQEVFLTAFRKLDQCDPERPLGPWLRGIAVKLLANHQRKFRAMPVGLAGELQSLLDSELGSYTEAENEGAALEALRDCLDLLDGNAKNLLQSRYVEGLTLEELAQKLQRKTSAVSMQLHRLRVMLGDCMDKKLNSPLHSADAR